MAINVTPIPRLTVLAAPAFTLGTANAAGNAITAVASNSTLLAFNATLPDAITFGQSGAVGSAVLPPRLDHSHAMVADPTIAAPGVSKAWAKVATAGTSFNAVYGFSGVSKPATGRRTLTLTTAMSTANWSAVTDVNASGSGVYSQVDVTAATTVDIYIYNTSHAATDNSTMIACYGEQ